MCSFCFIDKTNSSVKQCVFSPSTCEPHWCCDWVAAKKSVHLHPDEFRVLDRLPKGCIYIKRGSWHVMKLFLLLCRHTALLHRGAGLYPRMQQQQQPPPLINMTVWTLRKQRCEKMQRRVFRCLKLFLSLVIFPQSQSWLWRKVGGRQHFFPSTVPPPAPSIRQWTACLGFLVYFTH